MTFQANELLDWSTIHDRIRTALPFEGRGRCPSETAFLSWIGSLIGWCRSEFGPELLGEYHIGGVKVCEPNAIWSETPFPGNSDLSSVVIRFRNEDDCLRFLLHYG